MKCYNCGIENDSSAAFCRNCGQLIKQRSMEELYPERFFQPTSTFTLPGNKLWWFAIIPLFILFLYALYFAGGSIFYEGMVHGDAAFAFIGGGAGILVVIISYILLKKCYKKTKTFKLENIADYIEGKKKRNRYLIIIKNGLWGLYDTKQHKIQISCQYNYLTWDKNDSILKATKNNLKFLIDPYNNVLK